MSALDNIIECGGNTRCCESATCDECFGGAAKELADLRARALPQSVVDAVRAYQESYLTLQGLKGGDEKRKIEWQRSKGHRDAGTKRALLDAIEADAKGST